MKIVFSIGRNAADKKATVNPPLQVRAAPLRITIIIKTTPPWSIEASSK